jgi:hypothetical protein
MPSNLRRPISGTTAHQSPSIVPDAFDRDIYLVLNNFGGLVWPETDMAHTDRLIRHLLDGGGQCSSPVRFNAAESWSLDVTDDIAAELVGACADRREIPPSIAEFNADHQSE